MIYTFARPLPSTAPCFLCQTIYPASHAPKLGGHSLQKIVATVLNYFEMPESVIHLKCRKKEYVKCRYFIMLFLWQKGRMKKSPIAKHFSMNHASVLHGLKTIANDIETSEDYMKDYEALQMMLKS